VSLFFYKSIAALLIFLISVVAILYPLRKKHTHTHTESLELGEALASGIFLGAAFFHLLPDAIALFNQIYPHTSYPIPELICVGGFLLMLFLERLSIIHATCHPRHTIPYVLAAILIIHALTEGAALGIGTTISSTTMLFIAIVAHKGSESFALCVTLMRYRLPMWELVTIIAIFSLMTPLGIGVGASINNLSPAANGELIEGIFKAFAAGTFLYISTLHHIRFHQHTEETQGLLEFGFLTLGLVLMAVIALWT